MKKIFEAVKKVVNKVKEFVGNVLHKIHEFFNKHEEAIKAVGLTVLYCSTATVLWVLNVYDNAYNKGFMHGNKIGYMDGIYKGYDECMNFVKTCLTNSIPDNDIIGG